MRLTPAQQAIVDARLGTVRVLAAVGSGKTTVLSYRIAALLQEVEPARILALTFTNRAAHQLRQRVAQTAGLQAASQVWLSTFHALCLRLLRAEHQAIGLPQGFRVIDEEDATDLLIEVGGGARDWYGLGNAMSNETTPTRARWEQAAWSPHRTRERARAYVQALLSEDAIDFGSLVYLSRALLAEDEAARARWEGAFDAVLVDEVQDTHPSEYEVLRHLARGASSFCLVGDLSQSIYGWRGARPQKLRRALDRDFGPVRDLLLTDNFRATRPLLSLAHALAGQMGDEGAPPQPPPQAPEGPPPTCTRFKSNEAEANGVALRVAEAIASGVAPEQIAVLARANWQVEALSTALQRAAIPTITTEALRFFRHTEVKDALALAWLVLDRHAEPAARRVIRRIVTDMPPATSRSFLADARPLGLRFSDLLQDEGDPLDTLDTLPLVVLDVEATGLDPLQDEVIEIAAVRLPDGERFEVLLQNTVPVGLSEQVHHISDAHLRAHGRPAAQVFAELARFIGDAPIAGHNVGYDRATLRSHAARVGVSLDLPVAFDTLDAARRLVRAPSHKLGDLVALLHLPVTPTHRAMDDVLATIELARHLAALRTAQAPERARVLAAYRPHLARLRRALDGWRAQRPAQLIASLNEAVLLKKVRGAAAHRHLLELVGQVRAMDDPALSPADALARVLDQTVLSRDVDHLDRLDGVRVITIHQAKGLEFDTVFVTGLHDGGVPSARAIKDDKLDEELRVLYVAITRARQGLHLSWVGQGRWGGAQQISRFLAAAGVG